MRSTSAATDTSTRTATAASPISAAVSSSFPLMSAQTTLAPSRGEEHRHRSPHARPRPGDHRDLALDASHASPLSAISALRGPAHPCRARKTAAGVGPAMGAARPRPRHQQGAGRPAHEFARVRPGEAGDIGQPRQRFDPGRAANGDGEAMSLGCRHVRQGLEGLLDPLDGTSLAQRQLRPLGRVGFEREPQHRALLRLGFEDHLRERRRRRGRAAPRRRRARLRAAATRPRSRGARRRAGPAGSGSTGTPWCARSTPPPPPPRLSACDPSATSSRAAATSASRVRRFWATRPFSS